MHYQRRRDAVLTTLERIGLAAPKPLASLYVWGPVPRGTKSVDFSLRLLDETAVWITPGVGFGPAGEGFFRISLDDAGRSTGRGAGAVGALPTVDGSMEGRQGV